VSEVVDVRQSQLNSFDNCGIAFERRELYKEVIPPGIAMLRGSGFHAGAEHNHKQKRRTGKDLPSKELVDVAIATFDSIRSNEGYRLTLEEMSIGAKPMIARTKHAIKGLTELYSERVARWIHPDLVEARITVKIAEGVTLSGTLDLSTIEGRVKDFKTTSRAKSQADADGSIQLTTYGLLYHGLKGKHATGFDIEQLIDHKIPKYIPIRTARTIGDYRALVNRINFYLRALKAGIFAPAAVGAWNCCAKWCGYWSTCPFVNSERAAAASATVESR
jgi:uncharacterized Fe-S cluster protein YjdI